MRSIFSFLLILLAAISLCCSGEPVDSPKPEPASDTKTHKSPVKIERFEIKRKDPISPEKLEKARPFSLGQASRISGITPAAIWTLMMHLKHLDRGESRPLRQDD